MRPLESGARNWALTLAWKILKIRGYVEMPLKIRPMEEGYRAIGRVSYTSRFWKDREASFLMGSLNTW